MYGSRHTSTSIYRSTCFEKAGVADGMYALTSTENSSEQ